MQAGLYAAFGFLRMSRIIFAICTVTLLLLVVERIGDSKQIEDRFLSQLMLAAIDFTGHVPVVLV